MSVFDKIIGYEDIKEELKRFADYLKNPEKYKKLGVSFPSGIFLHGDPGLGKSLMAKCFIEESGVKCFTLRKEKPNGDFVNQIKETYESAKKEAVSIVFLDDLDKFANEDVDHTDAEEYVAVQSCIDDCKDHSVFTLATANDWYRLPDSLVRAGRFDKVIEVECPKGKDSEAIVGYYLGQKQVLGDVDVEEIARFLEERSCAEIESVINEAGIYAAYSGKEMIEQEDLIKACMRLLFDLPECLDPEEDENTYNIAVHEAGHAVVSEVLESGSVTLVTVFNRPHSIGGFTQFKNPSQYYTSMELHENAVIRSLGGKAATAIVCGLTDVGCHKDLMSAFEIVEDFVDDYCAYGFESFERNSASNWLLEKKDRLVGAEVEKYYERAKTIIRENRELYDAILEMLLEKKTITYRDIQKIRNGSENAAPYKKFTFSDFNVNDNNREAFDAAMEVAKDPGKEYNPLVIYGKNSTGKTHLLNAIGNMISKEKPDLKVAYIPANDYISKVIEWISKGDTSAPRPFTDFDDVDVLLFDDFQMLEGKEATMDFFCNHFNKLHMDGTQIVIAMDRPIISFTEVPARMISRLEWGKIVEIAQ